MSKNKRVTVWVERLGFLSCLIFFIKGIFCGILIHYSEHHVSQSGRKFLYLLKGLKMGGNFQAINLLEHYKDSEGVSSVYAIYKDYDLCLNNFCDRHIPDKPKDFREMVKSYLAYFIYRQIRFIAAVESKIKSQKTGNNIIYLARHPLNSLLEPIIKDKDYIIRETWFSFKAIRFFLRPCYYVLFILLGKILPFKVKTNIKKIRPAIWVEYCAGHTGAFDFTFWRCAVKSGNFDIVYYFDRQDSPYDITTANGMEERGLKWIDSSFLSLLKMSRFKLSELMKLVFRYLSLVGRIPASLNLFYFEQDMRFRIYESVFRRFKVKILIQHRDSSPFQGTQANAVESAGGIMLGFHWSSFINCRIPTHVLPHHVYFVWGKFMYDWAQKKGNTCRYILPSGLWISQDKQLPRELDSLAKSLKFIIAIFDNPAGLSLDEFVTPASLSDFYLKILNLLENNPSWGGIIKSKHYNRIDDFRSLVRGEEIFAKMHLFVNQNRLVLLPSKNSPVSAAAKADLSVCYTLNSAGVISAIHGNRVIHWDCAGVRKHPFYNDPGQKFIYNTLNDFEGAIIESSRGDFSIGDFSRHKKDSNYFEDLSAPQRIGSFMQSFMDEIIKTDDSNYALAAAAERYISENNIDSEFFKIGNLWSDDE